MFRVTARHRLYRNSLEDLGAEMVLTADKPACGISRTRVRLSTAPQRNN